MGAKYFCILNLSHSTFCCIYTLKCVQRKLDTTDTAIEMHLLRPILKCTFCHFNRSSAISNPSCSFPSELDYWIPISARVLIIVRKRGKPNSLTRYNFEWQSIQNLQTKTAINAFFDTLNTSKFTCFFFTNVTQWAHLSNYEISSDVQLTLGALRLKNQVRISLGQGLEFDMKYHILHDFKTFTPFKMIHFSTLPSSISLFWEMTTWTKLDITQKPISQIRFCKKILIVETFNY